MKSYNSNKNKSNLSFLTFLLLLSLLLISNSYAEDIENFSESLEQGIAFYENGDFNKAIVELKNVIDGLKDRQADEVRNETLFKANLYTGLSYLGKGKENLARDYFKNAIFVQPNKILDPDLFPPKVISLYNEIHNQNLSTLSIQSNVDGSEVFIDNIKKGNTPLVIRDLLPGDHVLKVVTANQEILKTVSLEPGKDISIVTNFQLTPITYSVKISSVPEGAEIFFDERASGPTPVVIENVAQGEHKIKILKEGYAELNDTIKVNTPLTDKTYTLSPYTGSLYIKTEPPGADVLIDGKMKGLTPVAVSALPVKQYTLQLKKEGYQGKNITANIAKDETLMIEETLIEIDNRPPDIIFNPLSNAIKENKNFIKVQVLDNQAVGEVLLMIKMEDWGKFQEVKMDKKMKSIYETLIPDFYLKDKAIIDYYIYACDTQNNCVTAGSKESPYKLKITSLQPYTEGFVLDVTSEKDRTKVTISLGSADGIKKEDQYVVFRAGRELRDPITGELLQVEEIFIGTIKVRELMPRTAYAIVESAILPIERNDRIRKAVSAPTGVVTQGNYPTKINLKWSPNREPEVKGYRIFRSPTVEGKYKKIGEVYGRDNTSYEDTDDMREGLTFYYKITAFNIFRTDSMMSKPVLGETKEVGRPPENVRAEGTMVREIRLRWDIKRHDPDIKDYIIYRSEIEDSQFVEIAQVDGEADSYIDRKNLGDGKTYFYRLASKSRHGSIGKLSSPVKAKTKDVPSPPQKIHTFSNMVKMVKLSWEKHPDSDVAGYIIYRNDRQSGTYKSIGKTERTEFLDKDLSDGNKYYYTVASFYYVRGDEIVGRTSEPVSAETKHRPKPPSGVFAESGLARKVNLKWKNNEEKDIAEYWIFRGTDGKIDRSPLKKVKADITVFTDVNLKDDSAYYYAIKAYDIDGLESDFSEIVNATTKPIPVPPKGLEGHADKGNKIYLQWKPNEEKDIKGYNIYKKGFFKSTLLATSELNSFEIQLNDNVRSIELCVTAFDKDGLESEPSASIEIKFK